VPVDFVRVVVVSVLLRTFVEEEEDAGCVGVEADVEEKELTERDEKDI
jgi:hypothetical protein